MAWCGSGAALTYCNEFTSYILDTPQINNLAACSSLRTVVLQCSTTVEYFLMW